MSLINDALRRASQAERNRPRRAPAPMAMEPAVTARTSRLSLIMVGTALASLLLACWFFWQWWTMRHNAVVTQVMSVAAPVEIVAPPVVAAPKPAPAPAPIPTPAAPAKPALVPPSKLIPAVVVPTAPSGLPQSNVTQAPWPADLKLNAIFFSKINPRVLINGDVYGTGDDIQGIVLKKIEKDKVTLEWNKHTRVLTLEQQ